MEQDLEAVHCWITCRRRRAGWSRNDSPISARSVKHSGSGSAEFERLEQRKNEVQDMVQELGAFIVGLDITLRQSVNDVRMASVRRCVRTIEVAGSTGLARVMTRCLPLTDSLGRSQAVMMNL